MIRAGIVVAALATSACQPQESSEPAPRVDPLARQDTEFADTTELLEAIERGTFAGRVGLDEQLEALRVPPPVKIEFVRGTQVPDDQQDELRELAAALEADDRLRVDLVGCSDPSGPEALNLRVSRSRAQSVAARLRELGVSDAQLGDVVGRGEACERQERVVLVTPTLRDPDDVAPQGGARPPRPAVVGDGRAQRSSRSAATSSAFRMRERPSIPRRAASS